MFHSFHFLSLKKKFLINSPITFERIILDYTLEERLFHQAESSNGSKFLRLTPFLTLFSVTELTDDPSSIS